MIIDRSAYIVRHAGVYPGGAGTTRVGIWFDADPRPGFRRFLDAQCDALGIQGIEGIVPVPANDDPHIRVMVIISNEVDVATAASAWIEGVNALISTLPDGVIRGFQEESGVAAAMAVDSLTGPLYYDV